MRKLLCKVVGLGIISRVLIESVARDSEDNHAFSRLQSTRERPETVQCKNR